MNILIIGDPHFKTTNSNDTDLMTQAIIDVAKKLSLNLIVVLGDILDRHENIHMDPLCRSVQFLIQLSVISEVILLIGNHDRKNNKDFCSPIHPFTAFINHDRITVIDSTRYIKINNYNFTFVPYVPVGKFIDALNIIGEEWKNSNCIFAHQEFYGAQMGAIRSESGDKWSINYPLVISGHIHDYEVLQKNLIYAGTPMQHTFGDGNKKYVLLMNLDNDQRQITNIDLHLPRKHIIRCTTTELNSINFEPSRYIKLIITGTQADIKSVMLDSKIEVWRNAGVKISYKEIRSIKQINPLMLGKKLRFSERLKLAIIDNTDMLQILEQTSRI